MTSGYLLFNLWGLTSLLQGNAFESIHRRTFKLGKSRIWFLPSSRLISILFCERIAWCEQPWCLGNNSLFPSSALSPLEQCQWLLEMIEILASLTFSFNFFPHKCSVALNPFVFAHLSPIAHRHHSPTLHQMDTLNELDLSTSGTFADSDVCCMPHPGSPMSASQDAPVDQERYSDNTTAAFCIIAWPVRHSKGTF